MNTNQSRLPDACDGEDVVERLAALRRPAPDGFTARVMARLPERRDRAWRVAWRRLWPEGPAWLVPATVGALAAALVMVAVSLPGGPQTPVHPGITVHFQLHAPGASRVELVGNFTAWQTGKILLKGPDASGHWIADVELPEGRHEYAFLVDGQEWVADPFADVRRPDGFGRENAVLNL